MPPTFSIQPYHRWKNQTSRIEHRLCPSRMIIYVLVEDSPATRHKAIVMLDNPHNNPIHGPTSKPSTEDKLKLKTAVNAAGLNGLTVQKLLNGSFSPLYLFNTRETKLPKTEHIHIAISKNGFRLVVTMHPQIVILIHKILSLNTDFTFKRVDGKMDDLPFVGLVDRVKKRRVATRKPALTSHFLPQFSSQWSQECDNIKAQELTLLERDGMIQKRWNGNPERKKLVAQRKIWAARKAADCSAERDTIAEDNKASLERQRTLEAEIKSLQEQMKLDRHRSDLKEEFIVIRRDVDDENSLRREWNIRREEIVKELEQLRKGATTSGPHFHEAVGAGDQIFLDVDRVNNSIPSALSDHSRERRSLLPEAMFINSVNYGSESYAHRTESYANRTESYSIGLGQS
ncbi:hypothetical protein B0H14DRAFT_3657792 [Mycena olivaceomarginata]|nr:hypothetical protein B0H14DRAFT_3657792 [Mycena olivaceomarginata]